MRRMLDVCSGIGGISLGAHLTGAIETVAFSEVEPFPSAVLDHHWPHIPNLGDIHGITKARLAAEGLFPIHIVAGGFPCQPFSHAGKRKGQADTRNLWPEMARLVGEIEPEWFVGENVFGLLSIGVDRGKHHGYFGDIQRDLARLGYASGWCVLSAADAGAPHLRKRVFILANRDGERVEHAMRFLADAQQWGWHSGQQWDAGWKAGEATAVCGGQRGQVAHTEGDGWRTWWPESARLSGEAGAERDGIVGDPGGKLVRTGSDLARSLGETDAEAPGRGQGTVCHTTACSGSTMGDADRRECRGWSDSEGHQSHGAATGWHEGNREFESAGERSDVVAHAGSGQWNGRTQLSARRIEISRGQQLRDDVGGRDGSDMADSPGTRLPQRRQPWQQTGNAQAEPGAVNGSERCGTWSPQCGLGHATDGVSRWVVGRFPAGPGQAQRDWEAPRVVSQTVPLRAAKLKALGNSVMPLQIYPVFAAIVTTERAMEVSDAA